MNQKKNITVSYIGDLLYRPPENVLLVERDEDYVHACHLLTANTESDNVFNIMVRSMNHFSWLKDFAEQVKCPVILEEKTPLMVLKERWNVELPDWLTDAEVLTENLLEINVESHKLVRFETRYLSHFLGSAFIMEILNSKEVVSVIKALISRDVKETFIANPLLHRCLKEKCDLWAEASSETWIKELCDWLPKDIDLTWHSLSAWSILHGYPDKLLEYVLAPAQLHFVRKIPPASIRNLPLEPSALDQALAQIELFFVEVQDQVNSSNGFIKIVDMVSGRIHQEYYYILGILKNRQFKTTMLDIQAMQDKFKLCPGVSDNQLKVLAYHVKPNLPALLGAQDEWTASEWVQWTTKEYISYRTWQIHNKSYDKDLEQTVARFSDWYICEYASIQKEPDLSLVYCLNDVTSKRSEPGLTIILLVDCLPLPFNENLNDALRKVGFNRHNLSYQFAGLPTVTELNKTALFRGDWQEKSGDYEAILIKRAASDWGGKNVVYLTNLKSLSEMEAPQEATIVVLNILEADKLLHSDVESQNSTYEDELHRLFLRLANALFSLSQKWSGSKELIDVYVVTDHGACWILDEEKHSFDSMVVKKLFDNEKYRFSSVNEGQAKEIPQNLWDIGHRFKQPFVPQNMIYFIPRGHNTVRHAAAVKSYMHGGATPEEVIVPIAHYKLVEAAWRKPATRFLNLDFVADTVKAKFYVQRVVALEIELQNPNAVDIGILKATVMSPDTDLKSFETVTIPALSTKSFIINCFFKKAALGEKPLEIEIAYEIASEHQTITITHDCIFKSAFSSGFSLKDI